MNLAYPEILILPLILALIYLKRRRLTPAMRYPNTDLLKTISPSLRLRIRKPLLTILYSIFLGALAIAAARPFVTSSQALPQMRRNIMLAIDISGSMRATDFRTAFGFTNRLEAVKHVLAEFIETRKQDRLGLVVFGTNAFLQAPLTVDHEFILDMVRRLEVGMAGDDTAMGDGIGLSIKRIEEIEGDSKTIILLTDGVNRTGQVNPLKAAQIAKDLKIKIHTIGIGSEDGESGPRGSPFRTYRLQVPEYDAETLTKIAEITGGVYFNAASLESLQSVYREIDKLEETKSDEPLRLRQDELQSRFAGAALASYVIILLLSRWLLRKIP